MPNQAYMETRDQIAKRLMTDGEIGLTTSEARARLEQYGFNSLQEKKKQTIWSKLLNQFKDAMVLILIAAALISGFLAEWIDAAVILAIVVINAVLGLIQEGRAEKAIEALKKMTSPQARVIRDGELQIIEAAQLVPGDLIVLEAGDIVPADIRLFESSAMTADEASLTGESVPVRKDAAETYVDTMQLGDRHNMVFMSTPITSGRGRGVVIATGSQTIIGGIADRLQEIKEEETPLQRNLNQLGKWLGIVCIAVCAIVFARHFDGRRVFDHVYDRCQLGCSGHSGRSAGCGDNCSGAGHEANGGSERHR